MPAESSSAQACEIPLMAAPTRPPPHPPIRFSRPPLTPTHTSVQGTKRRIKITKKLKQNVLVFGVSSVESLGEAVLNSSPSWAAGGRPRGSFFFFFCVCVGWERTGRGGYEHRLVRKEVRDERGLRVSAPVPALCYPRPPRRTRYGSPAASSSRLRRGLGVVGWEGFLERLSFWR